MTAASGAASNPTRTAWVMVALIPVMYVVGLFGAYVVEGIVAPDTAGDQRSLASDLFGALVIAALVLLPTAAAWRFGLQGELLGGSTAPRRAGLAFCAVALVIVLGQLIANAVGGSY